MRIDKQTFTLDVKMEERRSDILKRSSDQSNRPSQNQQVSADRRPKKVRIVTDERSEQSSGQKENNVAMINTSERRANRPEGDEDAQRPARRQTFAVSVTTGTGRMAAKTDF